MILSGNFAFPTMLQSVAWLSFSVFDGSLKIENWKLQSIYSFCFSAKTFKIVDRTTQEGGGGIHSHGNSRPKRLPLRSPSPHANFFCPCPPSLPSHATLLWKGRSGKFVLPRSHFSNMNDFSTEYMKDLVITQRKTDSEVSLLLKERFPDKKGFSSRSVRRFCFENGINLRNRLSNDAVHAGRRCSGKYKFIRLRCLLFAVFFFFLPSFPCLYSRLYEHPSGFKIIFQLLAWICRLLSRLVFSRAVNKKWAVNTRLQHSPWFVNSTERN